MRTVKNSFVKRLKVQAAEASINGLEKVATHINEVVNEQQVRNDDDFYIYSNKDYKNDIEKLLWKAAVRAHDFHDSSMDTVQVQNLIESFAEEFIKTMHVTCKAEHGIGAHEPNLPGENLKRVIIEIED